MIVSRRVRVPEMVVLRKSHRNSHDAILDYLETRFCVSVSGIRDISLDLDNREYLLTYEYEKVFPKGLRISRGRGPMPRRFDQAQQKIIGHRRANRRLRKMFDGMIENSRCLVLDLKKEPVG